ncbi:MAG: hypothetical protein J7K00_05485 [Candidatus Diapherotrites archaeon]|nr:hypothetical protein [Candidatus Diapherotrites archaeon]
MVFTKDKIGQGAIEYLLMIAGAVVVAVVVIVLIQGMAQSGESQALDAQYNAQVETSKIGATILTGAGTSVGSGLKLCGGSVIGTGVIIPTGTTIPAKTYFPSNMVIPDTNDFMYNGANMTGGSQLAGSVIIDNDIVLNSAYTLGFDMLIPQGTHVLVGASAMEPGVYTIWQKGKINGC